MKLLDIGALQQSSQGLSGLKGEGAVSARGLFKQLLNGAGIQSGPAISQPAETNLSMNDAMQIIEKWIQSPEEGIDGDLLAALQALQGQKLEGADLKSLEELFQRWNRLSMAIRMRSQLLNIVNSSYKSTFSYIKY